MHRQEETLPTWFCHPPHMRHVRPGFRKRKKNKNKKVQVVKNALHIDVWGNELVSRKLQAENSFWQGFQFVLGRARLVLISHFNVGNSCTACGAISFSTGRFISVIKHWRGLSTMHSVSDKLRLLTYAFVNEWKARSHKCSWSTSETDLECGVHQSFLKHVTLLPFSPLAPQFYLRLNFNEYVSRKIVISSKVVGLGGGSVTSRPPGDRPASAVAALLAARRGAWVFVAGRNQPTADQPTTWLKVVT